MEKIEIEEFVRILKGKIGKVLSIDENPEWIETTLDKGNVMHISEFKKHSKQLIDLIEIGDIVEDKYNKYEVAFVKDDKIYCNDYNLDDSLITLREQDIKTILAREQFEANCYKVGGEKC